MKKQGYSRPEVYNELSEQYAQKNPDSTETPTLGGDLNSKVLMVIPPPDEGRSMLGDEAGLVLLELLKSTGLRPNHQFLICPLAMSGQKAGKASTAFCVTFVKSFTRKNEPGAFQKIVLVGSDAFKFLLGKGKKPSSDTLNGSILYPQVFDYIPTMSLPDIHFFKELPAKDERERWRNEQFRNRWEKKYMIHLAKLKEFIA